MGNQAPSYPGYLAFFLRPLLSLLSFRMSMFPSMLLQKIFSQETVVWAATFTIATFTVSVTVIPLISYLFLTPRFDYNGKHVVITGGSSGIGLECAKLYAKEGANVTIVARDGQKLVEASKILSAFTQPNRKVLSVSVDTGSSEDAVAKALAPCVKELGDADVLVNCAGTSMTSPFETTSGAEFERMMRVNLLGSVYPTKFLVQGMKAKRSGRIVFVSSQVAQAAIHGYTAYAASKWALRGLAEALQMELKPFGVLVSVCYPPDTDTPGYKEEMLTKPDITKKLSESGSVFSPLVVARDVVHFSGQGYFGISTGLDGWLLKQLHPGMSPVNNVWEVVQGILFAPLCRLISIFYVIAWDMECRKAATGSSSAGGKVGASASPSSPKATTTATTVSRSTRSAKKAQ